MDKSNSEANSRTDFVFTPDYSIMWIAAFAARGSAKENKMSVFFEYDKTDDMFKEQRDALLKLLDTHTDDARVICKSKQGQYEISINENSDPNYRRVFKFWLLGDRYVPSLTIAHTDISNASLIDRIHSFLYTYGMLRGFSYEKYVKGNVIKVSKIYGNLSMLKSFNEMLYMMQSIDGRANPYIPRIHKGTRKDYYIELGPNLSSLLFDVSIGE